MYRTLILWPLLILCDVYHVSYGALPDSLSLSEFGEIMVQFSEEAGFYPGDNFVSNETSYLHPMPTLIEKGSPGGVYIGVGTERISLISQLHGPRSRLSLISAVRICYNIFCIRPYLPCLQIGRPSCRCCSADTERRKQIYLPTDMLPFQILWLTSKQQRQQTLWSSMPTG